MLKWSSLLLFVLAVALSLLLGVNSILPMSSGVIAIVSLVLDYFNISFSKLS